MTTENVTEVEAQALAVKGHGQPPGYIVFQPADRVYVEIGWQTWLADTWAQAEKILETCPPGSFIIRVRIPDEVWKRGVE